MSNENEELFGAWDDESAKDDHKTRKSLGGGSWKKWEVGENVMRVCPPAKGERKPFLLVKVHRVPVPGQEFDDQVECIGRGCRFCAIVEELYATKNPADKKKAGDMRGKVEVKFYAVDLDDEDSGPQKCSVTQKVFQSMEKIRLDPRKGGDFTHPQRGFALILEKIPPMTGDNKTTFPSITVSPVMQPCPLGTPEQMTEWAEALGPLSDLVRFTPYDDALEAVGAIEGTMEDAPQLEAPAVTTRVDDVIDTPFDAEDDEAFK